jgi:hypothetical protein
MEVSPAVGWASVKAGVRAAGRRDDEEGRGRKRKEEGSQMREHEIASRSSVHGLLSFMERHMSEFGPRIAQTRPTTFLSISHVCFMMGEGSS